MKKLEEVNNHLHKLVDIYRGSNKELQFKIEELNSSCKELKEKIKNLESKYETLDESSSELQEEYKHEKKWAENYLNCLEKDHKREKSIYHRMINQLTDGIKELDIHEDDKLKKNAYCMTLYIANEEEGYVLSSSDKLSLYLWIEENKKYFK